jgi:membrane fusion protein
MPVAWPVLGVFVAILVTVAVAFLATASYSRKESARGILRPFAGEARIMATRGGALRTLSVAEGDAVAQGQILGFVTTSQALEGGALVDEQVLAALTLEVETLRTRLAAFDAGAPLEQAELRATRAALLAEREAALQSVTTLRARSALAAERVAAAEALSERGLIALEELRRRSEAHLATEQAIVDAQARAASLAARVAETDARRARQSFSSAEGRAALDAQLANLAQRRAQAEAARGYALRAPIAGRVTGLQADPGQSLDPQRPVMTITPEGAALIAEVYVPSRAIGFIAPDQPVRLLYDAFPYQRFGPSHGTVQAISAGVLAPHEVNAAIRLEEPVYRVLVRLDAQAVRAFGAEHPIQPGMALTADIVLEERSFAEWLLEPVLAMRGRL